jgi:hypothetical protein
MSEYESYPSGQSNPERYGSSAPNERLVEESSSYSAGPASGPGQSLAEEEMAYEEAVYEAEAYERAAWEAGTYAEMEYEQILAAERDGGGGKSDNPFVETPSSTSPHAELVGSTHGSPSAQSTASEEQYVRAMEQQQQAEERMVQSETAAQNQEVSSLESSAESSLNASMQQAENFDNTILNG